MKIFMRILFIISSLLICINLSVNTSLLFDNNSFTYITKKINIAGQKITRSTPLINDVPTEGIDDIFSDGKFSAHLYMKNPKPAADFIITAKDAIKEALKYQSHSWINQSYRDNISSIYTQVFIMHFNEIRPAFKVRFPTTELSELKDIYIDGENGDLLKIDDVAQFINAQARLFVYSPKSSSLAVDLKSVTLKNLLNNKNNHFLNGEHIAVKNCCKYYSCPDDSSCENHERRCAYKSHQNARQQREIIEIPIEHFGFIENITDKKTLFIDTVRCSNLPSAKPDNHKDDDIVFLADPIDDASEEAEMDKFSEIQAYFSISSFFYYIRNLLDDHTWCLRKEAMLCNDNGSPILDQEQNPLKPYQVFVNQMIPDIKNNQVSNDDGILSQLKRGQGSKDHPIKINKLARIGNAAFVPALSTLKSPPRSDEILADLIRDFDHNVFFQGEKDFAYDGDVVFHEFMHAVTTSLVGKLNTLGLDEFGINSYPGSLNEGWSDYFSASFGNKSSIGDYASSGGHFDETALRNIDNNASCPDNIIGEVHHDSLIWSGALWEIRNHIKPQNIIEFDRAVLASLAQATISDDFSVQSQKLIDNIKLRPLLGDETAKLALTILEKRNISECNRVYELSFIDNNNIKTRDKDILFIASKNQIGLKNYAPSPLQLAINIPLGAQKIELSFKQYLAGNASLMSQEITDEFAANLQPLAIISNVNEPIKWQFKDGQAIPINLDNKPTITDTFYKDKYWRAIIPLNPKECHFRPLYLSILGKDLKYMLENIHVSFVIDEGQKNRSCQEDNYSGHRIGCGSHINSPIIIFIFMLMFYLRRLVRGQSCRE